MTKEALKLALEALERFEGNKKLWPEAITAIKEALAQPMAYLPPTQSPENACYTPPQRTWVGLTKEERHEISMANRPYCADIMAAHEEELKRRNT